MTEWSRVAIEEVADIFDGPHATPATVKSGPIFLGIGALQNGRINLGETRHVTPEDFKKWTRRVKPQADDVVFSYETRLGEAALIPKGFECCLGRRMGLVRAHRSNLSPRFFLYYYLSPEFQEFLRSRTVAGATVDRIALREFPSFPIVLPPLGEQEAIASMLGALDDKIDLNRRMNETLEAMAGAIFKDWFINFGPTHAKIEGRPPYLAPDVWALFPDRLDVDGKPEGWESQAVLDQADWINGAAYKNMYFVPASDGLPVVKIAELKNGVTAQTQFTNTNLGDRYKIDDGEMLFSWSGNPDTSIDTFIWTGGQAWLNQHIFAVRENGRRQTAFLYSMLKWLNPTFAELARNKQTTGLGHVTKDDLRRLRIVVPPPAVEAKFSSVASPILDRIREALYEIRTLDATRNFLLPKLVSGQIRVAAFDRKLTS